MREDATRFGELPVEPPRAGEPTRQGPAPAFRPLLRGPRAGLSLRVIQKILKKNHGVLRTTTNGH